MLTTSDFIHIAFTPDLTQAGIAYVCRSLTPIYTSPKDSPYEHLQQAVAEVAVELAFRRYLVSHGVPHNTHRVRPFTEPGQMTISLGGRLCEIKSHLITQRESIISLRKDPDSLLQASAQVSIDQLEPDHLSNKDLFVFAFVNALVTKTKDELEHAASVNQPSYCIHLLPENWARPTPWKSLGQLVLKADAPDPTTLELVGQGETRKFLNEQVQLSPRLRNCVHANFYSLAYMHKNQIHNARVGIHSPSLNQTYLIGLKDWGNIWVYGMDIILAGFITQSEFLHQARPLSSAGQVSQITTSRSKRLALTIRDLRPLVDLFKSAKDWSRGV